MDGAPLQPRCGSWSRAALLLLGSGLAGCVLQNATAERALRDSVHRLAQALRWEPAAAGAEVAPSFRKRFREAHRHWGRSLRIADVEVLRVRYLEGNRDRAKVLLGVQWYARQDLVLRRTLVGQCWQRLGGSRRYVLTSQWVEDGDERLLGAQGPPCGGGG